MQIMWVVLNVLRFSNKSLCAGASIEMQKYVLHALLTFSTFNWIKCVLGMQLGRRKRKRLRYIKYFFFFTKRVYCAKIMKKVKPIVNYVVNTG